MITAEFVSNHDITENEIPSRRRTVEQVTTLRLFANNISQTWRVILIINIIIILDGRKTHVARLDEWTRSQYKWETGMDRRRGWREKLKSK